MWQPIERAKRLLVEGKAYNVKLKNSEEIAVYAGALCFYIADELHFNIEFVCVK